VRAKSPLIIKQAEARPDLWLVGHVHRQHLHGAFKATVGLLYYYHYDKQSCQPDARNQLSFFDDQERYEYLCYLAR